MAINWRLQGNLKKISADIKAIIKGAVVYSVGDASHQSRKSDHNPYNWGYGIVVSAIDVMIRNGFTANHAKALVKALIGRSDIQYIIYNGTIWSASWGWTARKYLGSDPHRDHVHISAKHTKAADQDTRGVSFDTATKAAPRPKPVAKPKPKAKATKPREKAPAFPLGPNDSFSERRGSHGIRYNKHVELFQRELRQRGWTIGVDGKFGEKTGRVVRAFQKQKKLKVDGHVGPITWKAIWEAPVTSK